MTGVLQGSLTRPSDEEGVTKAGSTVGSQARRQDVEPAAAQQLQQKGDTAWSLLGKLYSSQVLAYMVAITDAQALVQRMRSMRPGPPLHIPGEVLCMDLWQVLQGSVQQQHVWTFGDQAPAELPARAAAEGQVQPASPEAAVSAAAASAAPADIDPLVQPCISSREPQAIKSGVKFISCAAGCQHSAAAAEGGYVFTWGSNHCGQLGCDTNTAQPVAIHVLRSPAVDATLALCSSTASAAAAPAGADAGRAMLTKLDSLKQLSSTVKLPPSLLAALQQQRQRAQQAAAEESELLLQEQLQPCGVNQQQQQQVALNAQIPRPHATQQAAHTALVGGLHGAAPQQQQQAGDAVRQQALAVYQLNLGQAVRSVACGAHHTLAALASSGLIAWGLNDKGQLGAPACLYQQANSPMRVHGFNGQRLLCISAGAKHSAAVQEGGVVVTWGHGRHGRLGVGGAPDILPPSVVSSLRGCLVTQVACGTAHTLALTADGRVYACGYNGQQALGTDDDTDRLFPVLVPGLPSCIQVAAAASSMALSSDSQVYVWGGAAGKRVTGSRGAAGAPAGSWGASDVSSAGSSCTGAACSTAPCESASAAAQGAASSSSTQKYCVPWLQGVSPVHITCGLDTAAAVTSTGDVLFWGTKHCLPASMLDQARSLASTATQCTTARTKVAAGGGSISSIDNSSSSSHLPAASGTQVSAASGQVGGQAQGSEGLPTGQQQKCQKQQPVGVQLLPQASGAVQLKLTLHCHEPSAACGGGQHAAEQSTPTAGKGEAAVGSANPEAAGASHAPCAHNQQPQKPRQRRQEHAQQQQPGDMPPGSSCGGFGPHQEAVLEVACGASHHVVLCQQTDHTPSHDELRAAVLAVLRAYISSFNSTNTSSLNLLMQQQQQQQQSEANWAGSIIGGPAKSTVSAKPAGGPSSVLFFACSPPNPKQAGATISISISGSTSAPGKAADAHNSAVSSMQRLGSMARHPVGATVSFADRRDCEEGVDPGDPGAHAAAAADSNKSALQSKAERAASVAPSVTASGAGKSQARSVPGGLDTSSGGGRRPGSAGVGPSSTRLALHGVLVLCKEVCLLDNITEHLDVIQAFELMLHRKRGRLGPPQSAIVQPAKEGLAAACSSSSTSGASSHGALSMQVGSGAASTIEQQTSAAAGAAATAVSSPPVVKPCQDGSQSQQPLQHSGPAGSPSSFAAEPATLRVVHVLRPNEPAVPPCSSADCSEGPPVSQGPGPGSRPASPGPLGANPRGHTTTTATSGSSSSRPGSRGAFGKAAVGHVAAAASGMDSIHSLDDWEVLEMLLLLMKERHPCYRRQPDTLLRMLAGWHLGRLTGRRSDQGPPWLLRQALQHDIVTALESHSTTEMLHGIYVALAGSSSINTQDLSMHLSDLRLGLRCAAGHCTPQQLQQQQQQQECRGAAMQHARGGSSCQQPQPAGDSSRSYGNQGSTESSRGREVDASPYDPSTRSDPGFQRTGKRGGKADGSRAEGCGGRSFQLPLYKLAGFIRTAKLLPRLLEKYLHQLQLLGGEQQRAANGQRIDSLPLMPCLQMQLQQVATAGASGTTAGAAHNAHSRRSTTQAPGAPPRLPSPSRLQQHSMQAEASGSFFDWPVGRGAEGLQHNSSSSSRLLSASPCSRRVSGDAQGPGLLSSREPLQTGGRKGRPRGRLNAAHALDASMIDAVALNSAELLPMRCNRACIQLIAPQAASTAGARLRSAGSAAGAGTGSGAATKLLLQLPPGGSTEPAGLGPGGSSNGGSSSNGQQVPAFGSAEWKQVVQSQQQGLARSKGKPANTAKATSYHQQQALLQQQQQAAAASAQLAEAQEAACQDAWIAMMLVELLGSCLITPTHSTAVRMPQPFSACTQSSRSRHPIAAACPPSNSSNTTASLVQQGVCAESAEHDGWCVWDRGYHFTREHPGAVQPNTSLSGSDSGSGGGHNGSNRSSNNGSHSGSKLSKSGCSGSNAMSASGASGCNRSGRPPSGVLDLLNYSITYPQFVEVLLCLMAARSVCILEPDVKEIGGITLNEELQDHAQVVLERIGKWRQTQQTPWKQQQQQQEQPGAAGASPNLLQSPDSSPTSMQQQQQHMQGPRQQAAAPTDGQQLMLRVYGAHSSMRPGSSVLGLHADGYLQLLRDASIVATNSEVTAADAIGIFKAVAESGPASSAGHHAQPSMTAAPGSSAAADGAPLSNHSSEGAPSGPPALGPEQRQSTFMRCVTQHLLQGLMAGGAGAPPSRPASGQPSPPQGSGAAQEAQAAGVGAATAAAASVVACPDMGASATKAQSCGMQSVKGYGRAGFEAGSNSQHGRQQAEANAGSSSTASSMTTADASRPNTGSSSGSGSSNTTTSSISSDSSSSTEGLPHTCLPSSAPPVVQASNMRGASSAAAAAAAAHPRGEAKAAGAQHVVTFTQFMRIMVQLSRRCFPRIANGARAWDLLLERHVQPLADRRHGRYQQLAASLRTPGMAALLEALEPQLRHLHSTTAATCAAATCHRMGPLRQHNPAGQSAAAAGTGTVAGAEPDAQPAVEADAGAGAGQQVLSLSGFLQVLQDRGVIPQLLEPGDVQEVLQQLLVTLPDQDTLFTSLDCSQFSQALSMCGLAAFAARRMQQHGSHMQAPEQQLAAFLKLIGLKALPGQQLQLRSGPNPLGPAPTYAGGATAGPAAATHSGNAGAGPLVSKHSSNVWQPQQQQQAPDPYIEWWSLQFDPAAESRAHDHLSSLHYLPVMLQDVLQPPECCPPEVLPLLSAAQSAHQAQVWDEALHLLQQAEQAWQEALTQSQQQQRSWSWQQSGEELGLSLPPAAVLYLVVSAGGCLLSAGRDAEAVQVLQGIGGVLHVVHEAGAEAALWHAAAGVAKYHQDDLKGAFEHLTRAYVIRSECGSLGVGHPDTAAAAHNLGVVLDRLGKSSRGLQLVQQARQVFSTTLGPQHARTLVAARNEQHIKHKIIKLPAQPAGLLLAGVAAAECTGLQAAAAQHSKPARKAGNRPGAAAPRDLSSRGPADTDSDSDTDGGGSNSSSNDGQRGGRAKASTVQGKGKGRAASHSQSGKQSSSKSRSSGNGSRGMAGGQRSRAAAAQHARALLQGGAGGARRGFGHADSMQERLQAVMQARHSKEEAVPRAQVDTRDYTDVSYLGASLFKASPAQQQLYRAVAADIQAHAQGLSSSSYSQQPGVVEVQVLHPVESTPGPTAAGAAAAAAAGRLGSAACHAPAAAAADLPDGSSRGAALAVQKPATAAGSATGLGGPAGPVVSSSGKAAAREVHRGALLDATIASVQRPATLEQMLRRRQQQQNEGRPDGAGSMLEKIYK